MDHRLFELRGRDLRASIPLVCVVIIMLTLGVFGNACAILFYGIQEKLKSVTHFLIFALAVNDFVACIVFFDEVYVGSQAFTFTDEAGCKAIFVLNHWVFENSMVLLTVVAIDRNRRICHPFSRQISPFVARVTAAIVTLTTLIIDLREAFFAAIVTKPIQMNDNTTLYGFVCSHTDREDYKSVILASNTLHMAIVVASIVVIVICYALIGRKIIRTKDAVTKYAVSTSMSSESNIDITIKPKDCEDTVAAENNLTEPAGQEILDALDHKPTQQEVVTVQRDSDDDIKTVEEKNATSAKKGRLERKLTKMIVTITVVSILSLVPYFVVIMLVPRHVTTEDNLSNMGKRAGRQFYMLNNVVNPYIMCFFNKRFRDFIRRACCKVMRCCAELSDAMN